MIAVTIASRAFGFLREAVVASAFGVSRELDLFLAALTLPAIFVTVAYYSIPNAFVPLWSLARANRRRVTREAVAVFAGSVIITLSMIWFSEKAAHLVATGFDEATLARASSLIRIGALAITCAAVEALLRSRLLSEKQFGLPGLSYMWQGVGVIVAALGWSAHGATALMWGTVAGTAGSALWNLGLLVFHHSPNADTQVVANETVGGRVWVWVLAIVVTDSLTQLYSIVDRHFGSFLEPGAIASLNYANLVATLPSATIGFALSTAILPFLSDAASAKDEERLRKITDTALQWSVLFALPVSIWLFCFANEIMGALFQRGAFDSAARDMTGIALRASAIGIVPIVLAAVWSRAFYADRNWRPIVAAVVLALAAKLFASMWLVSAIGYSGLALATSLGSVVLAGSIGLMQWSRIRLSVRNTVWLGVKILVLVGIPSVAFLFLASVIVPTDAVLRTLIAVIAIVVGIVMVIVIGRRFGITQMSDMKTYARQLRHRIFATPAP